MTMELYSWQKEAINKWSNNGFKGIISATTGTGKTFLAVKCMENIWRENPSTIVIVIVPSIALLKQWRLTIQDYFKLKPRKDIGLFGAGPKKNTPENKKILLYVSNSALKFLSQHIHDYLKEKDIFLIADECHRYGTSKLSDILSHNYKYRLGLSATPERESDYGFEDYLVRFLGNKIYEYNYSDAIKDGVISPFEVINYGVQLNNKDREEYRKLSEKIKDMKSILEARYPSILYKADRYIAELKRYEDRDKDVREFFNLSIERKRMLYESDSRIDCLLFILEKEQNKKIMIFHEDVEALNKIGQVLESKDYRIVIIHYKRKKGSFEDFKFGNFNIFLSAKMFSEGIDLPDVEVGIIAAASSSVRQKIQTMGRIMRKAKGKTKAIIYNIFIRNTTDERVFIKVNWDKILGKEIMASYLWPELKPITLSIIEKKRFRSEKDEEYRIKSGELKPGEIYTSKLSGERFSFDSEWRLFKKFPGRREYAKNQEDLKELVEMLKKLKPEAGSFWITDLGPVVFRNERNKLIYAGLFDKNSIKFVN